jgi:hypothetical protein
MLSLGTLSAGHMADAGAARSRVGAHIGSANGCTYVWQLAETKPATSVFHTDRPARRPWELSP